MICRFAYVEYSITNGKIKSIKNTNIAMVKSHIVKIKGIDYLIFDDCNDIFINGCKEKIKFKDFEEYIKIPKKNFLGKISVAFKITLFVLFHLVLCNYHFHLLKAIILFDYCVFSKKYL